MESVFSGYCRTIDDARMVMAEWDGAALDADCSYDVCVYRESCPIGQQLTAWVKQSEERL